jgi:hypothetical protein
MNKKKALISLMGLEMMLLAIIVVLFVSNVLSITVFVPLIIIVGAVFSALTIVAVRKFPLE